MLKFAIRRTLYMFPILFGIALVTFLLFNVAGGDPAAQAAGKYATAEKIQEMRESLGIAGPLHEQFFGHLKQMATFDFGRSWSTKQTIRSMIFSGIGASVSLMVPVYVISLILAISLALLVAFLRGTFFDGATLVVSLALMSISSLVYILAGQYFVGYELGLFPINGWDSSLIARWQYLVLPTLIFVVLSLGSNVLFYRTVFLDQMYQDYVRTARSKGLADRVILFKHVLRNAMIPIITVVVTQLPFMILGSLLLESFFGIPGLGRMIVDAIQSSDFPVIKAMTTITAILVLVFQLVADLLYAVVDPRVQVR
ncbi:MAG: ABC transporter permease [Bdellovibrionales bacterium]|nr:ABC transporter permease [Bdellovibrionales bacterium]